MTIMGKHGSFYVVLGRKEGALTLIDWHTNGPEPVDAKLGASLFVNLDSIAAVYFQVSFDKVLLIKVGVIKDS